MEFSRPTAYLGSVVNNRLTWEPSGLLLPAGPGGIIFIADVVLLAMLVATGNEEELWSFTGGKTDVCMCPFVSRVQDEHGYDGLPVP